MKPLLPLAALILCAVPVSAQDADPLAGIKAQVKDPAKPFSLIVEFHLKPGSEADFNAVAVPAVRGTRQEPGNAGYEVHQDAKDPTVFVFEEKWRSVAALEEHVGKEYTKALLGKIAEMSAAPMTARVLIPLIPPVGPAGPRSAGRPVEVKPAPAGVKPAPAPASK